MDGAEARLCSEFNQLWLVLLEVNINKKATKEKKTSLKKEPVNWSPLGINKYIETFWGSKRNPI